MQPVLVIGGICVVVYTADTCQAAPPPKAATHAAAKSPSKKGPRVHQARAEADRQATGATTVDLAGEATPTRTSVDQLIGIGQASATASEQAQPQSSTAWPITPPGSPVLDDARLPHVCGAQHDAADSNPQVLTETAESMLCGELDVDAEVKAMLLRILMVCVEPPTAVPRILAGVRQALIFLASLVKDPLVLANSLPERDAGFVELFGTLKGPYTPAEKQAAAAVLSDMLRLGPIIQNIVMQSPNIGLSGLIDAWGGSESFSNAVGSRAFSSCVVITPQDDAASDTSEEPLRAEHTEGCMYATAALASALLDAQRQHGPPAREQD
ncbi:hypothetical protein WJX72_012351 [[Myrmecia] bisecta]|uniref:Uncharacterized protein n=1 Tax=[Myrmecia] bisecta TaxID=41462 RepID=A0AAW1RAE4_9CHLO